MAVLVEWLRATQRRPDASPDDLRRWWERAPEELLATVGEFLELDAAERGLVSALAWHLLVAETRPGDVLVWDGEPDADWPRAARRLGARVAPAPSARGGSG